MAPIIVGGLYRGDIERERARRTAELRAAGETREIIFGLGPNDPEVIATGVPRGGRDEEYVAAFLSGLHGSAARPRTK